MDDDTTHDQPFHRIHPQTTTSRGRMSPAKRSALDDLAPRWVLPVDRPWTREFLTDAFGAGGPLLLDVGCGTGEATIAWARERPDASIIAIELHRPSIATLLTSLDSTAVGNVRLAVGDVQHLLTTVVTPSSVSAIRVLFPDPWPKRRHIGRRLVRPWFVGRCADVLVGGASLHVATDWPAYADHAVPRFAPAERHDDGSPGWEQPRPPRPVTTYEQRGRTAGRRPIDLMAVRRPDPTGS